MAWTEVSPSPPVDSTAGIRPLRPRLRRSQGTEPNVEEVDENGELSISYTDDVDHDFDELEADMRTDTDESDPDYQRGGKMSARTRTKASTTL
jgi:hypothetical protein